MSGEADVLSTRIKRVFAIDPTAVALDFGVQSYRWTFLSDTAAALDKALDGREEGEGAAVGLIMRNRPVHVATLGATIATRRCLVTLSPLFTDTALANDIATLGLHAVVGEAADLARPGLLDAARAAGVAVIEVRDDVTSPMRRIVDASTRRTARPRPGNVLEMLSSGTTGTPKRIPLSFLSLAASLAGDDAHSRIVGEEVLKLQVRPALVWHPIVHVSGAYFVIDALYSGRKIVLMERFDARTWADLIEREGVRVGHLNPAAMRMVIEADITPDQLRSLKVVRGGTAATPPDLQRAFEDRYGAPVLTTYGATEFAGAIVSWSPEDHRDFGRSHLGASGRAHPGVELRIVDPDSGAVLPGGESGVLEVLTRQVSTQPGAWVRTTDLARIDDEGFLWILGRVDDAIVRGGFKIHPAKIVAALEEHPCVRDAAVVGLADERLGEVPVAAVTRAEGATVESDELLDFLRARLAVYEVPRELLVLDELPLTASMKVSRPALRALFDK